MSDDGATQFDFWLGSWDLTWGDNGRGTNEITRILDGRVIQENFASYPDDDGQVLKGISVSVYTAANNQWQQTWVDNQGSYLDFVGNFSEDRMILSRDAVVNDKPVKQRMVWFNINEGAFDWAWERSEDEGRNWQTMWAIHYQRS